jgi:hypothetical protein
MGSTLLVLGIKWWEVNHFTVSCYQEFVPEGDFSKTIHTTFGFRYTSLVYVRLWLAFNFLHFIANIDTTFRPN